MYERNHIAFDEGGCARKIGLFSVYVLLCPEAVQKPRNGEERRNLFVWELDGSNLK